MNDRKEHSDRCTQYLDSLNASELISLFRLLPDVYFVVKDAEGRVMAANEVAVRLCGFESESDMRGKTDYDIFPEDRADSYVDDDRRVFETGEPIRDRVELAPDPNHSINWFVTTKVPLYGNRGEVVGLACIARNMTAMHETLRPYVEMNEVLEYIRTNYAQQIRIEELARLVHLSAGQFERNFKKVFGISPKQHILNVRLRAASHLLKSTHNTIASISQETGFYDHSHFCRSFKKEVGISPSQYRKNN
ncbi:AraC family transcriptional regulator [Pontiella sp. NLcol2]|uniref:AraC family transcriptional regulator n=1 Tax=Pontiella agarivorans TaxID=3038953 RepID=A0ABU5N122_9BACT|nr:AraC family transcriptional regulator [Pontiella agarivorans]